MQMFDETKKENWGGAWAIALALIVLLTLPGCNKRIYIGMDDYGETESMDHTFKTKRQGGK